MFYFRLRWPTAIGIALPFFALVVPTWAGNGTLNNGEYDFCVSVRFNATTAQLTQINDAFQNGSQVLADATDGQHRFGTITIVNDSGATQSAEYWVNPGGGRAYATFGLYGVRGEHVMLYLDDDFQANNGADGDAYTIAHEHAHHAYGVADEYSGPGFLGFPTDAECAAGPDTAALSFCLMDNFFTRGGNAPGVGGGYTLNEFCVASNHDPDADTFQESRNGMSCWETIGNGPAGLPVDATPGAHVVNFEVGFGGLRVMLLLDRSGSMSIQQRLVFAKSGAKTFLNFLRNDDAVGVASFSSSPSVNFPLTTITSSATKASARTAIDSLSAGGATNIGGGLLTALGQITAQTDRSCNEIIVLLSDGDHNTGTSPTAAIPQLQAEAATVLTVGVGSGISPSGQATLQNVATQTGGKFFRVANSFDLIGLFFRLAFESIGSGLLTQAPEAIGSGDTKETLVLLETGVENATFAVAIADAADDITLSLQTPSGTLLTETDAATNPNIDFFAEPNSLTFQVREPEAGTWSIIVSAGAVTTGTLEILAFAEHEGVQLNVAVAKDTLLFPEIVEIHAVPRFEGENIVGATVDGSVIRPDASTVDITLFDDGLPEHADTTAGDGIYSALFDNYNEDGTYTFELRMESSAGVTYAGEDLFASVGAPSNERPVPSLMRSASVTAVVTGVPEFVVATVEYGPETLNLKSQGNFVTAYIELPGDFSPAAIAVASVAVTAIDGADIAPIPAKAQPTEVGDFDNDGVPDLMVKFSRSALQEVLSPGMREIRLEGIVDGQLFVGERSVGVIMPGN